MAKGTCRVALLLGLAVSLFNLSLCTSIEPTQVKLHKLEKYQQTIATLRDIFGPHGSTSGEGVSIPLPVSFDWEDFYPDLNNTACMRDLLRFNSSLHSLNETWALKMLDADAKPPSGIMDLKLSWMGDYYECINVQAPAITNSSGFSGRYCNFKLTATILDSSLSLTTGLCVPSSCTVDELKYSKSLFLLGDRFPIKGLEFRLASFNVTANSCAVKTPYDAAAIGMLCLLSLFLLLMAAGTFLTILEKLQANGKRNVMIESSSVDYRILSDERGDARSIQEEPAEVDESLLRRFLKCFCVLTNGAKILSTDAKGHLSCVHGIRFLSMTWVILGHSYLSAATFLTSANVHEVMGDIDNLPFQALIQGTFSVDSFFLLSGFLLSYLFLREATLRDGKISWGFFYIHRYWRLTPVYAVVLGFSTALAVHVSEGPLWPVGSTDVNCRTSWWWNLLYINNFLDSTKSCMAWGWYLANDMQFYIISPIFLYVLWRWPKIGLSAITGVMVSSWIATGFICYYDTFTPQVPTVNNLPEIDDMTSGMNTMDYFNKIYVKPYTRIGPYLIGIALGYAVLYQTTHKKPIPKVVQLIGWALALAGGLGMVYGFYHAHLSQVGYSILVAVNRSIFAASLAWVIFACLSGYGGPVNAILSWKFLVPLSRLTYCAYLIHPIIIGSFYQSLRAPIQPTHSLMVAFFLGFLVMSYATALFCSLAFESSLMALEKLVVSQFKSLKKDPDSRSGNE